MHTAKWFRRPGDDATSTAVDIMLPRPWLGETALPNSNQTLALHSSDMLFFGKEIVYHIHLPVAWPADSIPAMVWMWPGGGGSWAGDIWSGGGWPGGGGASRPGGGGAGAAAHKAAGQEASAQPRPKGQARLVTGAPLAPMFRFPHGEIMFFTFFLRP